MAAPFNTQKPPAAGGPSRAGILRNSSPNYSATLPADKVLPLLDGVKQTGLGKWIARCPAHEDRSPSLSIREVDGGVGVLLVRCWAGCSVDSICAALGLTTADLFPPRTGRDFDPLFPRPKPPRFRPSELFPLVVTEALILALAWRTVADGGELSEEDTLRADLAENAVMAAWVEVCHG